MPYYKKNYEIFKFKDGLRRYFYLGCINRIEEELNKVGLESLGDSFPQIRSIYAESYQTIH